MTSAAGHFQKGGRCRQTICIVAQNESTYPAEPTGRCKLGALAQHVPKVQVKSTLLYVILYGRARSVRQAIKSTSKENHRAIIVVTIPKRSVRRGTANWKRRIMSISGQGPKEGTCGGGSSIAMRGRARNAMSLCTSIYILSRGKRFNWVQGLLIVLLASLRLFRRWVSSMSSPLKLYKNPCFVQNDLPRLSFILSDLQVIDRTSKERARSTFRRIPDQSLDLEIGGLIRGQPARTTP